MFIELRLKIRQEARVMRVMVHGDEVQFVSGF